MAKKSVRVKFTEDHETNSNPEDKMKFKKDQVCHFPPERARFFVNRGVCVALDDVNAQDTAEVPEDERDQTDTAPSNLKSDTVGPAPDTVGRAGPNETSRTKGTALPTGGDKEEGEGQEPAQAGQSGQADAGGAKAESGAANPANAPRAGTPARGGPPARGGAQGGDKK